MEGKVNQGYQGDLGLPGPGEGPAAVAGAGAGAGAGTGGWQGLVSSWASSHSGLVNAASLLTVAALYHAYFFYCLGRHIMYDLPIFSCGEDVECKKSYDTNDPDKPDKPAVWCDSLAFLIIITSLVWAAFIYGYVVKPLLGPLLSRSLMPHLTTATNRFLKLRFANLALYGLVLAAVATFLVIDTKEDRGRLVGAAGFLALVFLGWVSSVHPTRVRWRHVFWGHSLQFLFALIVLRWQLGKDVIQCLSAKVTTFLNYSYSGASFVFGYLATGKPFDPTKVDNFNVPEAGDQLGVIKNVLKEINSGNFVGVPFFFGPLSIIYFVSFCVSMLYYWGALQWIVQKLGWMLYVTVGTTAAESMNAAANIFLGQTEAPLLIRPYLPTMTKSEIHAVMVGGFGSIAGTILGAYIAMGIEAKHLITCSFMAAPTSLAVSKLLYPETETSVTTIKDIKIEKGEEANVLDAAAKGASTAIMLVLNIGASLLAFVAFITFLNEAVTWFGGHAGLEGLTFTEILGYMLWPVAFCLGVPKEDCETVGRLIGKKMLITEFAAFPDLIAEYDDGNGTLSKRAYTIATYALCGFANFPSIGIQIGGFGAMAESRKSDIAQLALRAMLGGCLVSFLNACIAGIIVP